MYLYGFHPVREALRTRPREVRCVYVSSRKRGSRRQAVERLCSRHDIELQAVSEGRLTQLGPGVHNGFVADVADADAIAATGGGDPDLVVLVEDVTDPRNLGALLRVCEGAGVGRVLLRDRGTAAITPVVAKTSAGAVEWLEIERITNSANTLEALKKDGFWVYGADAGGEAVWQADLQGKVVLCLGGEEKGLRPRTRDLCDKLVALPMLGRIASLNVAGAAAALLYEAVRQRQL